MWTWAFILRGDTKPLKRLSREVTDLLSNGFLTAGLRIDCGDKDWKRRSIRKELE